MTGRGRKMLLIGGLLVVVPVVGLMALSMSAKTPDSMGLKNGTLASCPDSPNCVSSQATDEQHRIEPITFGGNPIDAMEKLKRNLEAMPRTKIVLQTPRYLHAEVKSRVFRFTDDVELLLDSHEKIIHIRSASRVGYSDFGVNRSRVESLRKSFSESE